MVSVAAGAMGARLQGRREAASCASGPTEDAADGMHSGAAT